MEETCFKLFNLRSDKKIKSVFREQIAMIFCKVISFLVLTFKDLTFWIEKENSDILEEGFLTARSTIGRTGSGIILVVTSSSLPDLLT